MTHYRPRHGRVTLGARALRVARPVLAAAAIVSLTVAGFALLRPGGTDGAPARPHAGPAHTGTSASTSASPSSAPSSTLIGGPTGDLLVLPSLKVRAPLVSVAMSRAGVLSPPHDPTQVGYWSGSSTPGSRSGQTLVTGHTVHTGGGALDRLGALRPGAAVVIDRAQAHGRRFTYQVTSVHTYTKTQLAQSAQQLFGQDHGAGRLQLVTCTGWDGHHYSGNTIVTAVPVPSST